MSQFEKDQHSIRNQPTVAVLVILFVIVFVGTLAFGDEAPRPVPDDVPNASVLFDELETNPDGTLVSPIQGDAVGGPILDMVNERLDKFRADQDQQYDGIFRELRELRSMKQQLDDMQASYTGVLDELKQARQERIEAREERKTILSLIGEMRSNITSALDGLREWNSERVGIVARVTGLTAKLDAVLTRWTPLQNLVDRINGLIVKLFITVLLLAGLIITVLLVGGFLYRKMNIKLDAISIATDILTAK